MLSFILTTMKANIQILSARAATNRSRAALALTTMALLAILPGASGSAKTNANDWSQLWQPNGAALPTPGKVRIGTVPDLGPEVENREWLMVPTRYHQLLFQDSTDRKKVAELYQLIDGVHVFLSGRSPARPATPIRTFLVPDEWGHSRCSQSSPAMRTGDKGDVPFLLTSLLHEETHLFNFAFLGGKAQGWWAGEFCCIYFQERARLAREGRALKPELQSRLPRGPAASLAELDTRGQRAFDEALAAQYFLEESYGRERFDEFHQQCLLASKAGHGGRLPEAIFQQVFGQPVAALNKEWQTFYGWTGERAPTKGGLADARLDATVSYATQKESVQYIVQRLAEQVGLGYDFQKSKTQTDPLCRRWVNNVAIQQQPCRDALDSILKPVGLRYEIEGDAVVLYRK